MNAHYYGLILAGGRGTRFWPRSRKRSAKQVLPVVSERSLIQETVARLAPVIAPERLWVLTNHDLRDEIIRQLPEVPSEQVLAEPLQRNTAPAIGLAAHILRSQDPAAVMGVFPADHVIGKAAPYRKVLKAAFQGAKAGRIMVVGIQPRWPETGYGYVEFPKGSEAGSMQPLAVRRFHEKPELPKAKRYVAAGNFYWNSGMFFWRADVLLDQLRHHLPKTATLLASLPAFGAPKFAARLKETFPLCDNISIDYAVLEKAAEAKQVHGVAAGDFGWNDVGSWNAVYELLPRDQAGNVMAPGSIALHASNNFVDARGKLVALLGVQDLIIVDTPDALLVATRDRAQQVGEIVKTLEKQSRHDLL
ncbi:Mannose-1-phosphate guanylyltransferase (GDP) [Candidatus Sulfopaludibacter sp. SbA3]|nr:Mannose-1-phosphate guanylyltransferase (GDP) [Candidatus Sulfopaludibacter sp. SbA3]